MQDLNDLTENEIKELLPIIGDRHKLKKAIQQKRAMVINLNQIKPVESEVESEVEPAKFVKNDPREQNIIINIFKTDKILTDELKKLADNVISEFCPFFLNCKSTGWQVINLRKGVLNCPVCSVTIIPQIRRDCSKFWDTNNFKRHLENFHYDAKSLFVNSFLEITMEAPETDIDVTAADIINTDSRNVATEIDSLTDNNSDGELSAIAEAIYSASTEDGCNAKDIGNTATSETETIANSQSDWIQFVNCLCFKHKLNKLFRMRVIVFGLLIFNLVLSDIIFINF